MARFRFKLEPLLRHRGDVERQNQLHCAELQRRIDDLNRSAQLLREQLAETDAAARELLVGPLDLPSVHLNQSLKRALEARLAELAQSMQTSRHELTAARESLIGASKDRKILEKLRERQQEHWRESAEKRQDP